MKSPLMGAQRFGELHVFLVPHPPAFGSQPLPAVTEGKEPTTVMSSRCPLAFTRRTQKPLSSLWKVTRQSNPRFDRWRVGVRRSRHSCVGFILARRAGAVPPRGPLRGERLMAR